jgi:hypothetical protein
MLVKYSCGCIGYLPSTSDGRSLLVTVCDRNQDNFDTYDLVWRNMEDKKMTPLSEKEEVIVIREISDLLHLGYRMRDLAQVISVINCK